MEQATNPTSATVRPFEFFKPGTFTAVNGQTYTFDAAAVREMVDSYRPEFSDAPLVVGHPKLTSPRFGRAEKLFVNDKGVAMCEAGGLVAEFAEMVNKGMYPKVSASIFLPSAKGNPTPGKHYLNHIGFLGGVAPAVKGLSMVEFAADDDGVASFAFEDRLEAGMWRSLRNWMLAKFGSDEAEQALPEWTVQSVADSAAQPDQKDDPQGVGTADASALLAFSTPSNQPNQEEIAMDAQKEARLAQLEAEHAELRKQVKTAADFAARTEVASFAEGLVKTGQVLPAHKDAVVEVLCQLDAANDGKGEVASFASADPEHADHGKTGGALLREMLNALPVQVSFQKLPDGAAAGTASFAAPAGYTVSAEGLDLMAKAEAHQKAHPGMSLIDAASAVQAQG